MIRVARISDTCVRVRWASDGRFDERPTMLAAARAHEHELQPRIRDGVAAYETAAMRVVVSRAADWSTPPRVEVRWRFGDMRGTLRHGDADPGNLGGPVHALDVIGSHNLPPLPPSLLSRRGATIVDDSRGPALDESDFPAVREQHPRALDLYAFVYGRDVRVALRDWVRVSGRPSLPPRAAFGLWYSRFWRHTDREFLDVADRFAREGMPLDVLVMDVDWHLHGWEGYDWDPECFPDPAAYMAALRERRLLTSFNVHPWVPLLPEDTHHAECRARLPRDVAAGEGIVFNHALREEATIAHEVCRRPMDDLGCDIWWIDGAHALLDGFDSQGLTNHAFMHFAERDGRRRPTVLARYGGPGSHRHGIGFSGDAHSHWAVLRRLVMLTARSANEAYGLWSHDIAGHMADRLDPEQLVRWVQAASFWPILRLHSGHGERLPWAYGDAACDAIRRAVQLRLRLLPHLYDLQWEAHLTGLSMYRPLYVDWPECEESYTVTDQAMLGAALLHAPVCARGREPGRTAARAVWLPPGEWHDVRSGARILGGRTLVARATLDETPLYGRAGGIVVTQAPGMRGADAVPDPLEIAVFHGADGAHLHHDDDGVTRAFENGAVSRTPIRYDDATAEVVIGPCTGDGPAPPARALVVRLLGVDAVDGVSVAGAELLSHARSRRGRGWTARLRAADLHTTPVRVRFDGARQAPRDGVDLARAAADLLQRLPGGLAAGAVCALDGAGVVVDAAPDGGDVVVRATAISGDTVRVTVDQPEQRIALDAEQPLDVHTVGVDADVRVGEVHLRLHREVALDRTHVRNVAILAADPVTGGDAPPAADDPRWQAITIPPPADPLDDPAARLDLMPWGWLDCAPTHFHLRTALRTDTAQDVLLHLPFSVGDPDHIRVHVDGARLEGRMQPLQDHQAEHVFPAHLAPGRHEVHVRVVHPQYMNFVALRVTAPDGSPARSVTASAAAVRQPVA